MKNSSRNQKTLMPVQAAKPPHTPAKMPFCRRKRLSFTFISIPPQVKQNLFLPEKLIYGSGTVYAAGLKWLQQDKNFRLSIVQTIGINAIDVPIHLSFQSILQLGVRRII